MKNMMLKPVINLLFTGMLFPLAKDYVKRSDNTWDDKAIVFLEELYDYLIKSVDA